MYFVLRAYAQLNTIQNLKQRKTAFLWASAIVEDHIAYDFNPLLSGLDLQSFYLA